MVVWAQKSIVLLLVVRILFCFVSAFSVVWHNIEVCSCTEYELQ